MAGRDGLCFSSIRTHRQVSSEGPPGGVHTGHRGANMGHTAMVPRDTGVTGRVPDSSSNTPESVARSIQQATPPVGKQLAAWKVSGGKVTLQRALQREGFRPHPVWGTNATYQSGWAKWSSWCATIKVNPFSGDVRPFLDFLAGLYEQGQIYQGLEYQ